MIKLDFESKAAALERVPSSSSTSDALEHPLRLLVVVAVVDVLVKVLLERRDEDCRVWAGGRQRRQTSAESDRGSRESIDSLNVRNLSVPGSNEIIMMYSFVYGVLLCAVPCGKGEGVSASESDI